MFYTKEDVEPAISTAIDIMGMPGQYLPIPFTYLAIETPKYGTIWYGDTQMNDEMIKEKCSLLSKKINEPVSAINLGTGYLVYNTGT